MVTLWYKIGYVKTNTKPIKTNKTALLRVRVRESTKRSIEEAAEYLETDQSTLIRLALREYLRHHLPHAA